LLVSDLAERGLDLLVVAMIAFNGEAFAGDILHICNRAARDINRCACLGKFEGDAFADAATGSGN
jgi:hypothetical protein